MSIKKNGVYRVTLTDRNNLGCGVGRIDDMVVFVRGGVDGDTVDTKIIKLAKSYCVGIIDEIVSPSPYRLNGGCEVSGKCGGCVFSDVTYEHELELKSSYVKQAFRRVGMPNVNVLPAVSDGREYGYRNKAQYPVSQSESGYSIGFYAAKTHRVIDCAQCLLQPKSFTAIISEIRSFCREKKISAYDENSGEGMLRHIYLRTAAATSQTMVCLVINGDEIGYEDEFVARLVKSFPEICSIYLNINRENTNVVLGREYKLIYGSETIVDELCSLRLEIHPAAFYQVNRTACEMLYAIAKQLADLDGSEVLLDLYCGIGSIGLTMAGDCKSVVGIEIIEKSVECAKRNAELNKIENAEFFCGDAGDARSILSEHYGIISPDIVVLDPPRKGCDEKLTEYMHELSPGRIVYISCNPDTLARDAVRLSEIGYRIGDVTPVNMFPRTAHVECVCAFERENK